MQAIKEVTKWDLDFQPNHLYLVDGDKILAFLPFGSKVPTYLSKPLTLDTKGRKFIEEKSHPFLIKSKSTLIEVKGSKGDTYFVDPEKGSCSCSGFKFRGTCKHIKEVLE